MNNPFDFNGCQFASFSYTNEYGEVSTYRVLLGASYEKAKEKKIETLIKSKFTNQRFEFARISLMNALLRNKSKKTQTNQSAGQQEAYINLHKGLRLHKKSGEIKVLANLIEKTQTAKQKAETLKNQRSGNFKVRKTVNSSQATIDKRDVEKALGLDKNKVVQFTLKKGCLNNAKVNGQTISF